MGRWILGVALWVGMTSASIAQTPEDTVRWVYDSMAQGGAAQARGLWHLSRPARREQFFSRRMVEFIIANDSHGNDLASACIDFDPAIPGNDYDGVEILRTLALRTRAEDTRTTVVANFSTFGQAAQVEYDFVTEDGLWKIDDIAGPGWRLSRIPCSAKPAAAPAPGDAFCYFAGADSLRLTLSSDRSAEIDMVSWQANGHSCAVRGRAQPEDGGWIMHAEEGCRLRMRITADQGIRFSDPQHHCKRWMCGQRAVLDGVTFPRSSQVDCARMPRGN